MTSVGLLEPEVIISVNETGVLSYELALATFIGCIWTTHLHRAAN